MAVSTSNSDVDFDEIVSGRALSFGSVADLYDRARPGYPTALVDGVLNYAALTDGARALEIGAGTGQATAQFAARGLRIDAIEPSETMADIARNRFDGAGLPVSVQSCELESAQLPPEAFDLAFAATSWHWLTPELRWEIVGRALAPSGALAVFWTWPCWRRTALRELLDAEYIESGAPVDAMGPMYPHEPDSAALAREWIQEVDDGGEFEDVKVQLFRWSVDYSATGYVELLGTYADHIVLAPEVRSRLFNGVHRVIERDGGQITLPYKTLLLLARRR